MVYTVERTGWDSREEQMKLDVRDTDDPVDLEQMDERVRLEEEEEARQRRLQALYESTSSLDHSQSSETKWFPCKPSRYNPHSRTYSEASIYRTNSKFSVKSISQTGKTLDFLMKCFWHCSPGCQQTA